MVTITLVASGVLVSTFGMVVGGLITNGLIDARTDTAKSIVDAGSVEAGDLLNSLISNPRDPLAGFSVQQVLSSINDGTTGVAVAIVPADARASLLRLQPQPATVPDRLRQAVAGNGFVHQRLDLAVGGAPTKLHLVFGRQITLTWGAVQLYYFFPLDEVVRQANLVTNTIAVTGIALVILMAVVAYLVTRMVVRPVRVAARTAQRLSNGLLDQRMAVVGEDDLAALAASFNQMAESLQRHILRLEEMSRLQRRFTSDVSHELRTPLTTVRMAADLLFSERERFAPPVARSAELLHAELDRFEGLLTDLLEISRFDAGFAALEAEPTDLRPLISQVVDRLDVVARRSGSEIEVRVPPDPVVAEVDQRRVERVLRNLIGNAIEHGDGAPITVRLAARGGAVAITVRDRGVGLKAGEEKLVFNRFWRADPSRARHTGGTGLGLSISAEDARLHGGWLEAWGSPGLGAQFRLTLPAKAGDRLASSPLRLVPPDLRPLVDAGAIPTPRRAPVRGLEPVGGAEAVDD